MSRTLVCPSCGAENPAGFRFCGQCTAPLFVTQVSEERKVVTTLFCDLVAFTAMSETADPEDVDALLRLGARDGQVVLELPSRRDGENPGADQRDEPDHDDGPRVPRHPAAEAVQEGRHGSIR